MKQVEPRRREERTTTTAATREPSQAVGPLQADALHNRNVALGPWLVLLRAGARPLGPLSLPILFAPEQSILLICADNKPNELLGPQDDEEKILLVVDEKKKIDSTNRRVPCSRLELSFRRSFFRFACCWADPPEQKN
jgi:hypothetical protein